MSDTELSAFIKVFIEEYKKENKDLKDEIKLELKQINTEIVEIKKELAVKNAVSSLYDVPKLKERVEELEKKEEARMEIEKNNDSNVRIQKLEAWRNYTAGGLAVCIFVLGYVIKLSIGG